MARVEMGRFLSSRPVSYFERLAVSDKAWFCLGGHVYNRKNTVLYQFQMPLKEDVSEKTYTIMDIAPM